MSQRQRHSVSKLIVHLIFTTKYRRRFIYGCMIVQLREAFYSAVVKLECEILEMDGEAEYVHPLVAYPYKLAVSSGMIFLKPFGLFRLSSSPVLGEGSRRVVC
ncbi:transposase [Escherichia coli]|nr:transposase [Escherichia coli]